MRVYEFQETLPAASAALKAAGEPSRLRMLKALEHGELCVCHLTDLLGLTQPTVSRHLAALRSAGLVEERKVGRWTYYRLSPAAPFLRRLLRAVKSWGEDDPIVLADRERAAGYREVPVAEFCSGKRRRR
ncbi:MAG: ArsR/SmtB family transcription factor [Planctomycetota bacterium]|jgi:arsenate reductase/ArsR family transcriptional regulator